MGFDWRRAESEVDSDIPDPFLHDEDEDGFARLREDEPVDGGDLLDSARETITLADVGGLDGCALVCCSRPGRVRWPRSPS